MPITPTVPLPNLHRSLGDRLAPLAGPPAPVQRAGFADEASLDAALSTVCTVVPLSWDFVPKQFHVSLVNLQRGRGPVVYINADTIYKMRNKGVARAREHGARHLLFLDADMDFPADTLVRLMAHGKPIVGGLCRGRREPFAATIWDEAPDGKIYRMPPMDHGLRSVAFTGGACLLIDMEVFAALDRVFPGEPHFMNRECYASDYSEANMMGEDFWFCMRARQAGYEVFVDQDLKVGHVTSAIITDDAEHRPTALFEKGSD